MLRAPIRRTLRTINPHNHSVAKGVLNVNEWKKESETPRYTDIINNALVISLPASKHSRLEPFMAKNKFQGNLEVIDAIDGLSPEFDATKSKLPPRTYACALSHAKALQYAKDKGWNAVIIFEDDIEFVPNFNTKLSQCVAELPAEWDLLWLSCPHKILTPIPYSPLLNRLNGSWGAYSMVINQRVFNHFIDKLNTGQFEADHAYYLDHGRMKSFIVKEYLVNHVGFISDRASKIETVEAHRRAKQP